MEARELGDSYEDSKSIVFNAGYVIEKALESSGGDVFVAKPRVWGEDSCTVVVKRFHGPIDLCFEAKEEFLREKHKHIGQILNVVSIGEKNALIVSEYMRGGDLFEQFQKVGLFPEYLARIYSSDLFNGTMQLHKAGICHRDLKPENCVLESDGTLKIIDFGLASRFDENTTFNDFCGSVEYAAPEILFRIPYRGPKVDTWACGVMLFEMVVGDVPFMDEAGSKTISFAFPESLVNDAGISEKCTSILKGLLCIDPHQRFDLSHALLSDWVDNQHMITAEDLQGVFSRAPRSVLVGRLFDIMKMQISLDMTFKNL